MVCKRTRTRIRLATSPVTSDAATRRVTVEEESTARVLHGTRAGARAGARLPDLFWTCAPVSAVLALRSRCREVRPPTYHNTHTTLIEYLSKLQRALTS